MIYLSIPDENNRNEFREECIGTESQINHGEKNGCEYWSYSYGIVIVKRKTLSFFLGQNNQLDSIKKALETGINEFMDESSFQRRIFEFYFSDPSGWRDA
jgi:hypothetical protein